MLDGVEKQEHTKPKEEQANGVYLQGNLDGPFLLASTLLASINVLTATEMLAAQPCSSCEFLFLEEALWALNEVLLGDGP